MSKVYAVQDGDGHWYIIPLELKEQFFEDMYCIPDDAFIEKYSQYMTGGDLNNIQLYAEL